MDYDINILVFIIGVSIDISMNVVACPNNGFGASLDIRLGLVVGLGLWKEWDEGFDVLFIKDYCLLNTLCVACLCLWRFLPKM